MNVPKARAAANPERFAATDSCVQCGLCLPHCPTYLQTRDEGDSPRGRIALIQAMARGELAADARMVAHLDGCLTCRACEAMCPSHVPYASLLDAARSELAARGDAPKTRPLEAWLLQRFTHSRGFRNIAHGLLRAWQLGGAGRLRGLSGNGRLAGAGRLHSLLPPMQKTTLLEMDQSSPDDAPGDADVQLFTGCAGELFDRQTLAAAKQVLERLGYRVRIPAAQTCCGALHLHAGDAAAARALQRANQAAFRDDLPILTTASGCGATLQDAVSWYGEDARGMARATEDISGFLLRADWSGIAYTDDPLRVALHTPCSLKHAMHGEAAVHALLARLPGVELIELTHEGRCCGAAGRHMIDHPKMADALADERISELTSQPPDLLVSSNIGCALHLRAALRRADVTVDIVHPVSLIARRIAGPDAPLAASGSVA
ncbi:(Fe-S)-binding protein [Acidihalobacter prosperus]|uniref:Glycolate oxidase iron-sulfur subunit n=1 Tax=Acidihalobacter prosperus TaxID=160660 RepID=A0A1A6C0I2_9GAMM|nr:(Fe-S)-binding protein [Acidihalobacter prosperus]OBS08066.1 hypothetical protein Thpro_022316 [Acidihalobacter prosperus]